ncbi:MAG: inorganic phosphate transporter [Candidatus Dormibacteria bacterium]
MGLDLLLLALALAFAVSIGAHYTGACMGMPLALGVVGERRALLLMAPLALLGAGLASQAVERRVGAGLLQHRLSLPAAALVLALAFSLTTLYNRWRIPTSTIQLLVSCLIGVGLATGAGVRWGATLGLVVLWVVAPPLAAAAGFGLTLLLDRSPLGRWPQLVRRGGAALLLIGLMASFSMGANDVANATGPLVSSRVLPLTAAGWAGGAGLALGVLSFGRPLLRRVAFDIVRVDRSMAAAAQLVQALVVLAAVSLGYFTSLNQALVGAMAGTGLARGRQTVRIGVLWGILRGWALGPASGLVLGYGGAWLAGAWLRP